MVKLWILWRYLTLRDLFLSQRFVKTGLRYLVSAPVRPAFTKTSIWKLRRNFVDLLPSATIFGCHMHSYWLSTFLVLSSSSLEPQFLKGVHCSECQSWSFFSVFHFLIFAGFVLFIRLSSESKLGFPSWHKCEFIYYLLIESDMSQLQPLFMCVYK